MSDMEVLLYEASREDVCVSVCVWWCEHEEFVTWQMWDTLGDNESRSRQISVAQRHAVQTGFWLLSHNLTASAWWSTHYDHWQAWISNIQSSWTSQACQILQILNNRLDRTNKGQFPLLLFWLRVQSWIQSALAQGLPAAVWAAGI